VCWGDPEQPSRTGRGAPLTPSEDRRRSTARSSTALTRHRTGWPRCSTSPGTSGCAGGALQVALGRRRPLTTVCWLCDARLRIWWSRQEAECAKACVVGSGYVFTRVDGQHWHPPTSPIGSSVSPLRLGYPAAGSTTSGTSPHHFSSPQATSRSYPSDSVTPPTRSPQILTATFYPPSAHTLPKPPQHW
jgi:hypothetical protein